jgi:hypothetical protein
VPSKIFSSDSDDARRPKNGFLLRSDDSAVGVTAGKNDAAMIDLLRRRHFVRWSRLKFGSLEQSAATGRTPVGDGLLSEQGAAVAADAFHAIKITGSAPSAAHG